MESNPNKQALDNNGHNIAELKYSFKIDFNTFLKWSALQIQACLQYKNLQSKTSHNKVIFNVFSMESFHSVALCYKEVDKNRRSERSSLKTFFGPGSGPYSNYLSVGPKVHYFFTNVKILCGRYIFV